MSVESVARRYATALADVVSQNGEVESIKGELKSWEQLITSNTELHSAFSNPSIAHMSKEKVLERLLERTRPSRTTSNFLRVLLRNNRLSDLPEINERFESELAERSGLATAQVTSARELSDAERKELKATLEKLTSRRVDLEFEIDGDIIGGIIARVGSTVYDGSVRTRLENLREQLMNG